MARSQAARFRGGHPPLGYRRGRDGRLVVDPKGAARVRLLFHEYPRQGSLSALAAFLARKRLLNRGRPWSRPALLWILRNAAYTGCVRAAGRTVRRAHPAIVTPRDFSRVQRILAGRRRRPVIALEEGVRAAERNGHGDLVVGRPAAQGA